jgi:hypothetical protein
VAVCPLVVSVVEVADDTQVVFVVMVIDVDQDEATTGEVVVTFGVEIRCYVVSIAFQFRFDVGSQPDPGLEELPANRSSDRNASHVIFAIKAAMPMTDSRKDVSCFDDVSVADVFVFVVIIVTVFVTITDE